MMKNEWMIEWTEGGDQRASSLLDCWDSSSLVVRKVDFFSDSAGLGVSRGQTTEQFAGPNQSKPGPNSCPYIRRHRSLSCVWRGDSSLRGDLRRIEVGYSQDWWVNSQFKCESNQSRYLFIICLPLFPCRIGNRTQTKFDPKEKQRKHRYFNTL